MGVGWWDQGGPCRQYPPASLSQPCPLIKVVLSPECGFLGAWPQWGVGEGSHRLLGLSRLGPWYRWLVTVGLPWLHRRSTLE